VRLDELAERIAGRAQFLGIYSREAHGDGEDQVPIYLDDGVIFEQPTNLDDRADIASTCMSRCKFSFPMLLDNMDDKAEAEYVAWPAIFRCRGIRTGAA